jgi:hypothetical protein
MLFDHNHRNYSKWPYDVMPVSLEGTGSSRLCTYEYHDSQQQFLNWMLAFITATKLHPLRNYKVAGDSLHQEISRVSSYLYPHKGSNYEAETKTKT